MSVIESQRAATWRQLAGAITDAPPDLAPDSQQWDAIITLAEGLRLAPLLAHDLRLQRDRMPLRARARLHRASRRGTLARIRAQNTLMEARVVLGSASVPFIVLKGLALGETIYPAPDCRPMSDLDLLISAEDRQEATHALLASGWEPLECTNGELSGGIEMVKPDVGLLPIELHWDFIHYEWLSRSACFRAEDVWPSTLLCAGGPVPFYSLLPEDSLIYLCLHLAAHHAFSEAWLLVDIDRLVRSHVLNWDVVTDKAVHGEVANATYFALAYAQRLLRTPVPEHVLERLSPSRTIICLVERLAPAERCITQSGSLGPQAIRVLHFLLVDRLGTRLRGIGRAFFPGRCWLATRYGSADAPVQATAYALWHPLRIAGLGVKAAFQLLPSRIRRTRFPVRRDIHA